jgi:hypothetical protein
MATQHRGSIRRIGCVAALACALAGPVQAQDTRAEVIAREQAEKAKRLKPYEPSTAEKLVTRVTSGLIQLPGGLYPAMGSVYSGGGFAIGPGFRHFVSDNAYVDAKGLYSVRQYKLVDGAVVVPDLADGKLTLRGGGGWLDATQIGYYGIGMTTSLDDRTNYRMKEGYASARAEVRPVRPLFFGGEVSYLDFTLARGKGNRPSIEQRFTPAAAPGLGASPTYTRFSGVAGIDWRPAAGYARRGGLYEAGYHAWRDRDSTFSFNRADADIVQHLPFFRENWVLSLHGRVQTTVGDDDVVPYFLLPQLGSGSTLRGYSTGRFRGRHSMLLQAEWRWIPNRSGLDAAIFYDAGKVTERREDLDFQGLKSNFGIGIRIHAPRATLLRIDVARGNEGFHFVFATGAAF